MKNILSVICHWAQTKILLKSWSVQEHLHRPPDEMFVRELQSPVRLRALFPFQVRFLKGSSTNIHIDVDIWSKQMFSQNFKLPPHPLKSREDNNL